MDKNRIIPKEVMAGILQFLPASAQKDVVVSSSKLVDVGLNALANQINHKTATLGDARQAFRRFSDLSGKNRLKLVALLKKVDFRDRPGVRKAAYEVAVESGDKEAMKWIEGQKFLRFTAEEKQDVMKEMIERGHIDAVHNLVKLENFEPKQLLRYKMLAAARQKIAGGEVREGYMEFEGKTVSGEQGLVESRGYVHRMHRVVVALDPVAVALASILNDLPKGDGKLHKDGVDDSHWAKVLRTAVIAKDIYAVRAILSNTDLKFEIDRTTLELAWQIKSTIIVRMLEDDPRSRGSDRVVCLL